MATTEKTYKTYTGYLILVFSLFRLAIASIVELGNDEAYYWLYSQDLQWNYFDHPPLVALWTKLFTLNLWADNETALRLGSIAGCAIASWILFRTVAQLHSERSGFFAACLYNTSLYAGLTAGIYLMPDSAQMVFWTLSLWGIVQITKRDRSWLAWLLFGAASGLCIMSKVHGGFLWIGMGLYILFQKRDWLRLPQLYAAAGMSLLLISPIIVWNIQNDFATYRFHSQRVVIANAPFLQFSFLREVFHQALWNNPVNVVLILAGITAFMRRRIDRLPALSIYLFIGIPFALSLLFISFFRDTVLIHWSGPAYVSLLPLAAIRVASVSLNPFPKILKYHFGLLSIAVVVWLWMVNFYPGTLGDQRDEKLGKGDLTLDMYGWQKAGQAFAALYKKEIAAGIMPANTPLVCSYWWGAHIEYYFGRPTGAQMIGLGSLSGLHHYQWTNGLRVRNTNLQTAYAIMPSDDNYAIPSDYYRQVEQATTIHIKRSGKPAHHFKVYRLRGLRKAMSVAY